MFPSIADKSAQPPTPRIAVITCGVLRDEVAHFTRGLTHIVHVEELQQGLHNDPPLLRRELMKCIEKVETIAPTAEAIVLGYGLCSRGVEGVFTRRCRLVMARAHDCITLLLGDKQRYADYAAKHPGTYWYSPGWNRCHTPPGKERHDKLLKQYTEKFGEDDAQFLMENEQAWFQKYDRATYVDLGVAATPEDLKYTEDCANWLGWNYDRQKGCSNLLEDLLWGRWDERRFLVLEPMQTPKMTADDHIVTALTIHGEHYEPG
jgi:hypothetical protein